ncbi:DNA polymerase II [Sulfodiicoccus acidiphilus]|uniref:DNA-directed DNA polymerase n=1 Tax=Sulfodiicoccus acidiphilus TaxID=1670455 RepID=A0A348B563_9CREN|nr:DNA polymerase II [Sulfodiicoccus acidiphilus]GGT89166.1 DNA polymerase II [Sulfodiicoccus acidiphilus]
MEGYVVDALPGDGHVTLILDGNRKVDVRTTFPLYALTDEPERVMEHPDVVDHEEEVWRDLDGREVRLHRYELRNLWAYRYVSRKVRTVNRIPTVLSQALARLGASPFRRVKVEGGRVQVLPQDELAFPPVRVATVSTVDWYGPSTSGTEYVASVDGRVLRGRLRDLNLRADVVECSGSSCDRVEAAVKIRSEEKRSPVSVRGLVEWSFLSRTPLRELASATIGKALTTNEAWVALKRRVVVWDVVPRVEKPKTLGQLRAADKGGLILFPKVGCHDGAVQVDFSSMYPSLIVKYNISAETVDACRDLTTEVGHSLCLRERGIVPEALSWLLKRREALRSVDQERAEAVKWILVASFGYLGYRNSRFGRIEAYELVTYFARKTLRAALDMAGELGLQVLHGIVDSLVVKGDRALDFPSLLQESTGLRVKSEPMEWVAFFPRGDGLPYPGRYVARTPDGVKAKGVVRSNQPRLVADFLVELLELMGEARDCGELRQVKGKALELLGRYREKALYGSPADYVIWVRGVPYVRGPRGFYDARRGYAGRDALYYENYLRRTYEEVVGWL